MNRRAFIASLMGGLLASTAGCTTNNSTMSKREFPHDVSQIETESHTVTKISDHEGEAGDDTVLYIVSNHMGWEVACP